MTGAFDGEPLRTGGNEGESGIHFVERTKPVAGAVDEESRGLQSREVLGAELVGTTRGVERIGGQEQRFDNSGLGGGEHRGLASAIRMAAEEDTGRTETAHRFDSGAEAGLIPRGAVARRTMGAKLAEGQVAAEDGEASLAEGVSEGDEERGLAVGAGAMGEDEAEFRGRGGAMEETLDGRIGGRVAELCGGCGGDLVHGRSPWYARTGTAPRSCA